MGSRYSDDLSTIVDAIGQAGIRTRQRAKIRKARLAGPEKRMRAALGIGRAHRLPGVIDGEGRAVVSSVQGSQIAQAALFGPEESMSIRPVSVSGLAHRLPGKVDIVDPRAAMAHRAQVAHRVKSLSLRGPREGE